MGNHRYFSCNQKKPCGIDGCTIYHHVLLHNNIKSSETVTSIKNNHRNNADAKKTCNSMKVDSHVKRFPDIFRIVPVKLYFNGASIRIYAYFDDGSNLTTLALSVAKKLKLCGSRESLFVKWSFGDTQVEFDSQRVSVQISGDFEGADMFNLTDVRTVKNLCLPTQSITKDWLHQYPHMNGVPIISYHNATPQLIIGLQFSSLMVSLETIEGDWSQPIVCRTFIAK